MLMKYNYKTDEKELIIGLQNGSEAAFNEIYRRYHKLVFFVANRTCHNTADAQDIAQETFLTIREHAKDIRNPKFFRLWIYRIISSKCKNMFNKNNRFIYPAEDEFFSNKLIEHRNDFVPHQDMHFKNDQEVLNYLIDQLSEGQRLVMIMYYLEQFTIPEIAQILEIPEGTVKSRMSAGRKALEQLVEEYETSTNQKLNFHSLTEAIPLVLTASLSHYKAASLPKMKLKPTSTSMLHSATTFLSTHIVTSLMIASAIAGGVYYAHDHINNERDSSNQATSSLPNAKNVEQVVFEPINIDGELIDSSKKGFYTLQLYVCCEKDMEDLTIEQLQVIQPLYEEMKLHGGAYYTQLVDMGWATAYEEKIK